MSLDRTRAARLSARAQCRPADEPLGKTLLRRLLSQPAASRGHLIDQEAEFQRPELAERLIQASSAQIFRNPTYALGLARLAVRLADLLDDPRLAVLARLEHANVLRVQGELEDSEELCSQAEALLPKSPPRNLLQGRVLDFRASLRNDQGRREEALALVHRAHRCFEGAGDRHWQCEALIKKGVILLLATRSSDGLRAFRQALPLLDPERDLRLFVICLHNLVIGLNELGYSIAARSLLRDLRGLHEVLDDEMNLLRLRWLEGNIARELGQLEEAERAFVETQEGFLGHSLSYQAAMVSLNLAEVYLQQSRTHKLRDLTLAMMPIFQSRSIHTEALAALIVFREAVSLHTADVELVREISTFLEKAQSNHKLRYRPSH